MAEPFYGMNAARLIPSPRIVLVRPVFSGNVGSVCRLAANFGSPGISLVNPAPLDWDFVDQMAVHSRELAGEIAIHTDLREAIAECDAVIGTTARTSGARKRTVDIREFALEWRRSGGTARPAVVFGSEENGLNNQELEICTHLITIPTIPVQPSMNLSHAVAVVLHELTVVRAATSMRQIASATETEAMFDHLKQSLLSTGYLNLQNPDHIFSEIRELIARARPRSREVRILHGIAAVIAKASTK